MNLPAEWKRLTEARRRELYILAHKPLRTVQQYYATMATTRILLDLKASGLAVVEMALTAGSGNYFQVHATPAGRALVAEVERLAEAEACRQLWEWLHAPLPCLRTAHTL